VFENRMLRRIFRWKRDEVIDCWRKLHNEELHILYFWTNMIKMVKSRKVEWEGHVAHMGRTGMHIGFWLESH
jgi:hypothetical protein